MDVHMLSTLVFALFSVISVDSRTLRDLQRQLDDKRGQRLQPRELGQETETVNELIQISRCRSACLRHYAAALGDSWCTAEAVGQCADCWQTCYMLASSSLHSLCPSTGSRLSSAVCGGGCVTACSAHDRHERLRARGGIPVGEGPGGERLSCIHSRPLSVRATTSGMVKISWQHANLDCFRPIPDAISEHFVYVLLWRQSTADSHWLILTETDRKMYETRDAMVVLARSAHFRLLVVGDSGLLTESDLHTTDGPILWQSSRFGTESSGSEPKIDQLLPTFEDSDYVDGGIYWGQVAPYLALCGVVLVLCACAIVAILCPRRYYNTCCFWDMQGIKQPSSPVPIVSLSPPTSDRGLTSTVNSTGATANCTNLGQTQDTYAVNLDEAQSHPPFYLPVLSGGRSPYQLYYAYDRRTAVTSSGLHPNPAATAAHALSKQLTGGRPDGRTNEAYYSSIDAMDQLHNHSYKYAVQQRVPANTPCASSVATVTDGSDFATTSAVSDL